jgi:4-diphosphocytidyl-2-C-methyl-D-erythritol kinase
MDRPDTSFLIKAIEGKKVDLLAKNMKNVLESVTIKQHLIIGEIKDQLIELGAAGSMMSGSGPTVFGIFSNIKQAEYAFKSIKKSFLEVDVFLTQTIS